MPTYEYRCLHCSKLTEAVRRIAERDDCPRCSLCCAPTVRRITATMLASFTPYKTVVCDKEAGRPMVIRNAAEHRAFLARNGFEEVGNDRSMAPPSPEEVQQRTLEQQDLDEHTFNFDETTHEAT